MSTISPHGFLPMKPEVVAAADHLSAAHAEEAY
jgi:hypothetical protein